MERALRIQRTGDNWEMGEGGRGRKRGGEEGEGEATVARSIHDCWGGTGPCAARPPLGRTARKEAAPVVAAAGQTGKERLRHQACTGHTRAGTVAGWARHRAGTWAVTPMTVPGRINQVGRGGG